MHYGAGKEEALPLPAVVRTFSGMRAVLGLSKSRVPQYPLAPGNELYHMQDWVRCRRSGVDGGPDFERMRGTLASNSCVERRQVLTPTDKGADRMVGNQDDEHCSGTGRTRR